MATNDVGRKLRRAVAQVNRAVEAFNADAHTPGPWSIVDRLRVIGPDGCTVAGVFDRRTPADTGDANARLIAAAPELLHALRCIQERAVYGCDLSRPGDRELKQIRQLADAAIAAAEKGN